MADVEDAGQRRQAGRVGTLIKDKWRIDARIGSGGMATVYAATHRNGNRVALKMLHTEFSRDPAVKSRFLREGYLANKVGHVGAVRILDDDVAEDGAVFLVMELLEGESLEKRRERLLGRLPLEEVFTVGDQLLDLLASAHEKGIVHRDIKPDNVFITSEGRVKLLDFGIARLTDSSAEKTSTGILLGTPDFMSPEQAAGGEVDARSDLWATSATMFMLLSGENVHKSNTLRDHLLALANRPARSLADAAPDVPSQVVAVVDRGLALKPEERWPDARTMQDALRWAYRSYKLGDDPSSVTMMASPGSMPISKPRSSAPGVQPVSTSEGSHEELGAEATVISPPVGIGDEPTENSQGGGLGRSLAAPPVASGGVASEVPTHMLPSPQDSALPSSRPTRLEGRSARARVSPASDPSSSDAPKSSAGRREPESVPSISIVIPPGSGQPSSIAPRSFESGPIRESAAHAAVARGTTPRERALRVALPLSFFVLTILGLWFLLQLFR